MFTTFIKIEVPVASPTSVHTSTGSHMSHKLTTQRQEYHYVLFMSYNENLKQIKEHKSCDGRKKH
jgi:hypothetical protein